MANPRLLITRFSPQAQRLANALLQQGVYSLAQPLLKIEPVTASFPPFSHHYDYIIAVSRNAVEYTHQNLMGCEWPKCRYFSVGEATQSLLEYRSNQPVVIPTTSFDSEGLLALAQLQRLENRSILILRGMGGRELLREELLARGASVDYYESYQRVAIKLSRSMTVDKWQQQAINGAIISSIELLEQLSFLVKCEDAGWLKALIIYSASQRILNHAVALGFTKTALLPSMADQDIINYFTDEGSYD